MTNAFESVGRLITNYVSMFNVLVVSIFTFTGENIANTFFKKYSGFFKRALQDLIFTIAIFFIVYQKWILF